MDEINNMWNVWQGNWVYQLLIFYGLLCLFVYFVSDTLMFPMPSPSYQEKQIPVPLLRLNTEDGKKIVALYLHNPKATYTILFSHGNGEDLWQIFPFLSALEKQGFSVFAYDYHGYGLSEGRPSENNCYLDIKAAYQYVVNELKIASHKIILYGRSIGSGPTIELATQKPIAGVILEGAFLTAFRVITMLPIFPFDKFRNNAKIAKISVPILFIHAKEDRIIPLWHGKELFKLARSPKSFYLVESAGHNDIAEVGQRRYWDKIIQFSNSLNK